MLLFGATTLAGSGPWLLGPGDQSVYTGVEVQRPTRLHVVTDGDGGDAVIDVGEGLSTFGTGAMHCSASGIRASPEVGVDVRIRAGAPSCQGLWGPDRSPRSGA
jgi:hypothetical protein